MTFVLRCCEATLLHAARLRDSLEKEEKILGYKVCKRGFFSALLFSATFFLPLEREIQSSVQSDHHIQTQQFVVELTVVFSRTRGRFFIVRTAICSSSRCSSRSNHATSSTIVQWPLKPLRPPNALKAALAATLNQRLLHRTEAP